MLHARRPTTLPGRLPGVVVLTTFLALTAACSGGTATTTTTAAPTSTAATGDGTTASSQPGATTTTTASPADLIATAGPAPDYTDPANWLALPADTPAPVDVFWTSPTAYHRSGPDGPVFAPIDDPGMRQGNQSAFGRDATAFAAAGNIFSPYYRQVDAAYALSQPPAENDQLVAGPPTQDVTAAFEEFLAKHNDGRPFILVAHSQGAQVTENLITGYLAEHPEVAKRMIAAYIIGWSVTEDALAAHPILRFAERADDVGVVISYNTEAPTISAPSPITRPGGVAINPVTWTRTGEEAPASASLGARLPDDSGTFVRMPGYADARVDAERGVVITTTADVDKWAPGTPGGFPRGVFHSVDMPLYYYDLEANALLRVQTYLTAHQG